MTFRVNEGPSDSPAVSGTFSTMFVELNKTSDVFRCRHVSDYIEELQSRASDNMESMKTRLDPYFTQVRDNAEAKITTLNELLKTQVDNVRDQVQTAGKDLRSALGAKMEELRNWFEPFVTMIRESM